MTNMMITGIQQLWIKRKAWIVVMVLLGSGAVLGAVRYSNPVARGSNV